MLLGSRRHDEDEERYKSLTIGASHPTFNSSTFLILTYRRDDAFHCSCSTRFRGSLTTVHYHPHHEALEYDNYDGGLGDWDDDDDEFYGDFDDYLARRGFMDKLKKLNPFKKSKKSQGYGRIAGEEEPGERPAKDTDSTEGIAPDSPKKGGKSKKGGR
ncbi:hypothetical protein ABKN59_010985 [Abortiporus biennis]